MKLNVDFSALEKLRKQIGAPYKAIKIIGLDKRDPEIRIKRELVEGVEISLSEIETTGPFITYKNVQAILYIKDTMNTLEEIRYKKHTRAKKFHLVWCKTLEEKKQKGSYKGRYVATRRTDGTFKVDAFTDDKKSKKIESEEELYVCQNCLEKITHKGFSEHSPKSKRRELVEEFEISEFLDEYEGIVRYLALPTGTDTTEPLAEYTTDFVKRSRVVKETANYTCEECGVYLGDRENIKLLHCHHQNHKKHDNTWGNLKAICALCHQQNHHKQMYVSPKAKQKIIHLRSITPAKKPAFSLE